MTTPTPLRRMLEESVATAEPRPDLALSTLNEARAHRRQRFMVAGSALAAAAVVLGFVVVTQPFGVDTAPRPDDVASQVPAPDADGDGRVELTLDAPRGAESQIGLVQGTTLHLESGATVELPKAYDDAVSFQGGYLAADAIDGRIDEIFDGEVVSSFRGSGRLGSADGNFVAWFEPSASGPGQIAIRFATEPVQGYMESTIEVPSGLHATPVAFRGQGVLYKTDDGSNGDRKVWFGESGRAFEIEGATAIGGYDAATDQAVVQTTVTDTGSCWSTYAFPGGEFAGALTEQTCDFSLGPFSADSKYLIGWPAYADGWGPGEVAILDAETFQPVVQFDSKRDYGVMNAVWDGDSHSLIATVYLDGQWQLQRLGLDGSLESVSDQVQADDVSNPFRFAQVE